GGTIHCMPPSFRQHAVFNGIVGRKTNAEQYKVGVISVDSIQITTYDIQPTGDTIPRMPPSVRQKAGFSRVAGRKTNAEQYKVGVIADDSTLIPRCDLPS